MKFLASVCGELMPSHLLMLQCAGINQHTSVNLGFSSLIFFDEIQKRYQPQEHNSCWWVCLQVHYWNTMTHKHILQGTSLNQLQFGIYYKNKRQSTFYMTYSSDIVNSHTKNRIRNPISVAYKWRPVYLLLLLFCLLFFYCYGELICIQ